ncbi:MAG: hypothetical protein ACW99A_04940 [Candidatus Kariarchaeaceae archaeon]|jgi:hypothetical protein
MVLYAVYLITNDGREMMSEIFQSPKNIPNNAILSALLTAFQAMSEDLTKKPGSAEQLNLRGLNYHIQFFGNFQVVLVTDGESRPAKVLTTLGWRFYKHYAEVLNAWTGNQKLFENFRDDIHEVVKKHLEVDMSGSLDPTKILDTATIFEMDPNLRPTALALLTLEKATMAEIMDEVDIEVNLLQEHLEELKDQGYIGVRDKEGEDLYFTVALRT